MTDREFLEKTFNVLEGNVVHRVREEIDDVQFYVNTVVIKDNIWKYLHNMNEVEEMNEEFKAKKPEVTEEEVRAVFNDLKDAVKMAKEYFSGSDSAPTKEEVLARVGNIKSRLTEMVEKLEGKEAEEPEPKNQKLTVYVKGCFEEFTFEPDEYTEYYYDGKFFHIMNDFQTVGMFALSEIIYVVVGDKL